MNNPAVKLWSGRFEGSTDPRVERLNASIGFDYRLALYDVAVNRAHGRMLHRIGVLDEAEWATLQTALEDIEIEIRSGNFEFRFDHEDIHMNIEAALTERTGSAGAKIHTARSRNDQVAADFRLYLRDGIDSVLERLGMVQSALVRKAGENVDAVMPGYTHLQRAQPVRFAHHLLAYFEMFGRDMQRFREARARTNRSPLGAAALAGTTFPIDRFGVAEELGFDGVIGNSLDAVADRDFVLDFLHAASVLMVHLSRLGEELILWMSQEFGFIDLPDRFCTGSSIMPQKKNPDVAELIRGKSGRVFGHVTSMLALLKGLPLAYNKDLQEDKEPVFDTLDTLLVILDLLPDLLEGMTVNVQRMRDACRDGFLEATDLADWLAGRGVPFREAHHQVGELVKHCVQQKKRISDLELDELKQFCPASNKEVFEYLELDRVVDRRISHGGTSRAEVELALVELEGKEGA